MKYCSECGGKVTLKVPENDDRQRYVCEACGVIHYQNPRMIAGVIPVWQDKVLLCRRAIEPRLGYWTFPAGFMENGETLEQAAIRETWEEAQAKVQHLRLYTVMSIPHLNQVYVTYRAELVDDAMATTVESSEVQLFAEHEIPWDRLAFPSIHRSLSSFFRERSLGAFKVHDLVLSSPPRRY